MRKTQATLILYINILAIFIAIILVQKKLTDDKDLTWYKESMSYLPKSNKLKPYLFGYHTTYANYLWIKTMLYFGEQYETSQDYQWLIPMVDIVTKLNPYFYPPYEFAALMLTDLCKNRDASKILIERGLTTFGNKKWQIPFYLGWHHFRHYNDKKTAANYLFLSAQNKEAPPHIAGLAASFMYDIGHKEQALLYLHSIYNSTENPKVKEHIKRKIDRKHFSSYTDN